jgi:hypothetical protein
MVLQALNTGIARIDNRKGYIQNIAQSVVAQCYSEVRKIVLKLIARLQILGDTALSFSRNYDVNSYVLKEYPARPQPVPSHLP